MFDIIKSMIGKDGIFKGVNFKRYEDDPNGDVMLYYDRPVCFIVPYQDKKILFSLYDEEKVEDNWVTMYSIEDVTGMTKEFIEEHLHNTKYPLVGVCMLNNKIIDYIEIIS